MTVGVVSDTHGLFDPLLPKLFSHAEMILHIGDICGERVLDELRKIAPVVAIRGNCDLRLETASYPDWILKHLIGWKILMIHDLGKPEHPRDRIASLIRERDPNIVLAGHSHMPFARVHEGVLFLNPGSAGKKKIQLTENCRFDGARRRKSKSRDLSIGPRLGFAQIADALR